MLRSLVDFLLGRKGAAPAQPEAPYKVETPVAAQTPESAPAKCGCGRSQSGLCVGLHKLTPEEWATHKDNPAATKPVKPAKAKKAPAAKKPAAMKAAPKSKAKKTAK